MSIIVDGSVNPNENLYKKNLNGLLYIHSPGDTYQSRMAQAAGLVKTPFTISMSDDEYFVPSSVAKAVQFMMENPEFAACAGEAVGFDARNEKLMLQVQYPELRGFCLELENPEIRMRTHLSRYRIGSYYSVIRTPVWARTWTEISKTSFTPYGISELQFEASVSFSGKLMVLPILMWWRNLINTPVRALSDPDDLAHVTFFEWWTSKDFIEEKQDFLKWTTKFMSGSLSISQADLDPTYLREAHRAYRNYFYANSPKLEHLRNTFKHILSRFSLNHDSTPAVSSAENLSSILPSSTSLDYNWIREISGRIKRFYELS